MALNRHSHLATLPLDQLGCLPLEESRRGLRDAGDQLGEGLRIGETEETIRKRLLIEHSPRVMLKRSKINRHGTSNIVSAEHK